ncbi:hypothetical protein CN957_32265 [Bacillus cereus]|nr:hypothetical protein II9_05562 [Bacillus cereus MSX-D12]PGM69231.1 hypothetical protein CN957_32265 [Bacillus cereus]
MKDFSFLGFLSYLYSEYSTVFNLIFGFIFIVIMLNVMKYAYGSNYARRSVKKSFKAVFLEISMLMLVAVVFLAGVYGAYAFINYTGVIK